MDQDATLGNKAFLEKVLNDIEKAELVQFADNPTLLQAVEKALLAPAYFQGKLEPGKEAKPGINFALNLAWEADRKDISDETIGRDIRTKTEAIKLILTAFSVLKTYKTPDKKPEKPKNQAR